MCRIYVLPDRSKDVALNIYKHLDTSPMNSLASSQAKEVNIIPGAIYIGPLAGERSVFFV